MKLLFVLFLTVGCSVAKFYRAPEVTSELKRNEIHLQTLMSKVEQDFQDKEAFLKSYAQDNKGKNAFLVSDLAWRLQNMKEKKEVILSKSAYIQEANSELLNVLNEKKVVKENDPEFEKIESFSEISSSEGKELLTEYHRYQDASLDFVKFAMFTGNVIRRQ
jgi:hypothetical protein